MITHAIFDVDVFFCDIFDDITLLNKKIDKHRINSKIYFFGAHIFSQFYLSNGINNLNIDGILDNDKSKQNLRIYGTPCLVKNPEIIAKDTDVTVILRAGAYNDEITKQLIKLNPRCKIL